MSHLTLTPPVRALLARAAAAACLTVVAAPGAQAAVTLTEIALGSVTDVSADGQAAVGMYASNYGTWRWTAAGGQVALGRNPYQKLHTGGGVPAISADGRIVAATILDDTGMVATEGRWTVDGGWQQLTPPLPADGGVMDRNDSDVFGMSRDGLVVTGLYWRSGQSGGSAHGSVWSAGTNMVGLATAGASSRVDDANGDGSVLVGWEESPENGQRQPAVWVNGVKTLLDGTGPDVLGEAEKVNTAGTVIVGQSYDVAKMQTVAARWTWDGSRWNRTLLGVLPGGRATAMSYALGVSDDGSVVVGFNRKNGLQPDATGFIWTAESGMVDFQQWLRGQGVDMRGRFLVSQVSAITPDGRFLFVTGTSTKPPYTMKSLRVERLDATASVR